MIMTKKRDNEKLSLFCLLIRRIHGILIFVCRFGSETSEINIKSGVFFSSFGCMPAFLLYKIKSQKRKEKDMAYKTYSMELGGRTLTMDVGRVAKQANGAVLMHYGETTVLCTATASEKPREGIDFFPLSVLSLEAIHLD